MTMALIPLPPNRSLSTKKKSWFSNLNRLSLNATKPSSNLPQKIDKFSNAEVMWYSDAPPSPGAESPLQMNIASGAIMQDTLPSPPLELCHLDASSIPSCPIIPPARNSSRPSLRLEIPVSPTSSRSPIPSFAYSHTGSEMSPAAKSAPVMLESWVTPQPLAVENNMYASSEEVHLTHGMPLMSPSSPQYDESSDLTLLLIPPTTIPIYHTTHTASMGHESVSSPNPFYHSPPTYQTVIKRRPRRPVSTPPLLPTIEECPTSWSSSVPTSSTLDSRRNELINCLRRIDSLFYELQNDM